MSPDLTGNAAYPRPRIVVIGVTGCGKTTVGKNLAKRLNLDFGDADDFHSKANIEKMAGGTPLTDEDRWPWLESIGQWLESHDDGAVAGCSALRVVYRDRIRAHCPDTYFVHLDGPMDVAVRRVAKRKGHFMPAKLVQSQYDTLEALTDDESGVVISFDQPVEAIVEKALRAIASLREASS